MGAGNSFGDLVEAEALSLTSWKPEENSPDVSAMCQV